MRNKTSPIIVNEIKRLSQEEGLHDKEIAVLIGYTRVSVQRIRSDYGIPACNLDMRKDRPHTCSYCKRKYMISRKGPKPIACPDCEIKLNKKIAESYAID